MSSIYVTFSLLSQPLPEIKSPILFPSFPFVAACCETLEKNKTSQRNLLSHISWPVALSSQLQFFHFVKVKLRLILLRLNLFARQKAAINGIFGRFVFQITSSPRRRRKWDSENTKPIYLSGYHQIIVYRFSFFLFCHLKRLDENSCRSKI